MKKLYAGILLIVLSSQINAAEKGLTEVMIDVKREKLFKQIIRDELSNEENPLSDQEVIDLKKDLDDWKRKQNTQLKDPEILNRSFPISFEPKTKAEELYFSPNYTTTIIFLDKLGNPWPLTKHIINKSKFQVEHIPPSTLIVTPLEEYAYGNLTVMLQGKTVPAIFTIRTSPDKVDYKVEARISDIGPNSKNANVTIPRKGGNGILRNNVSNPYSYFPEDDITDLLNGEPPAELLKNKKVAVGISDMEVYEYNEKLYILTSGIVRTPDPLDTRQNANGRNLFITMAMPQILVIENGELITVNIKD
jgi:intracellular multiplication protein IcmK